MRRTQGQTPARQGESLGRDLHLGQTRAGTDPEGTPDEKLEKEHGNEIGGTPEHVQGPPLPCHEGPEGHRHGGEQGQARCPQPAVQTGPEADLAGPCRMPPFLHPSLPPAVTSSTRHTITRYIQQSHPRPAGRFLLLDGPTVESRSGCPSGCGDRSDRAGQSASPDCLRRCTTSRDRRLSTRLYPSRPR